MPEALARALYAAALRLLTPLYLLRLWRRGAKEPLYRHAMVERLGFFAASTAPGRLWIHAVSLGETRAASALVEALRERDPALKLLLTHSTATGREAGQALLRDGDAQAWLPYDTPGAVRRFLRHWQPRLGVLMETEVWPTLQREAERAGVPMVLANARLSDKSLRQGLRLAALMRPAARRMTLALAQTAADAERIRAMGTARVEVAGNLKYDISVDQALIERGRAWAARLGRPVLMLAVSREGEEAALLAEWPRQPSPRPLLAIVPRHPQRFDEIAALIEGAGMKLARRSSWAAEPPAEALAVDVWLGDSMREMPLYYGLASVALLGGSFEPLGGQNLIEAAACGCPVLTGPHTFNFAEATQLALAAGAAERCASLAEAVTRGLALCAAPAAREAMSVSALAFSAAHRGAAGRMAAALLAL
ncbi:MULTISPECIES: 3-deoxy-D-manno-octulosonic acid transferase [unclassified Roseateles]|uniref:3-deoxy-D-manno-octulosonic acid transferase n=1 Tax=unclassified Roseateles TaxID=2626991 RepID=UPI0006FF3C20|nr:MULTISPECIES: 3-deoxy-D-manno-octulosonic acid transferase [unclassified Roseateles]KQW43539.1 3-deoxy-D-manno-octulosonic acid transferase [Pelomonas sp. Root405]KRA71277.1 3-deoxy-D-manno-octulosonic acid transferase [Pelomonas sp. Root662]